MLHASNVSITAEGSQAKRIGSQEAEVGAHQLSHRGHPSLRRVLHDTASDAEELHHSISFPGSPASWAQPTHLKRGLPLIRHTGQFHELNPPRGHFVTSCLVF